MNIVNALLVIEIDLSLHKNIKFIGGMNVNEKI